MLNHVDITFLVVGGCGRHVEMIVGIEVWGWGSKMTVSSFSLNPSYVASALDFNLFAEYPERWLSMPRACRNSGGT